MDADVVQSSGTLPPGVHHSERPVRSRARRRPRARTSSRCAPARRRTLGHEDAHDRRPQRARNRGVEAVCRAGWRQPLGSRSVVSAASSPQQAAAGRTRGRSSRGRRCRRVSSSRPTGRCRQAEEAGAFRATVRLTDSEARTLDYPRGVHRRRRSSPSAPSGCKQGKVGRLYRAKLAATGGVLPKTWKIKKGPLPRGIRFDKTLGVLSGTPTKAGRYRITVEVVDALKVKSTKSFTIIVLPAPKS